MKKIILTICVLSTSFIFAQDHFGGLNTSRRVGIINVGMNPSELANMSSKYELQLFGTSINVSNNKISFKDIIEGKDLESRLFNGNDGTNANLSVQIAAPGFAFKVKDWAFAITTNAFIQGSLIDFDSNFGRNLAVQNNISGASIAFGNNANQRFNATTWGEIGFSVARKIFEKGNHVINGGLTLKLMAPGVYSNFGAERFSGVLRSYTASPNPTELYLSGVNNATLNLAYSANMTGNFNSVENYTSNLIGGINGFGTDFGFNYIWKKSARSYKLKAGFSMRNIGSMTFKGANNQSSTYSLTIPTGTILNPGLNISVFDNVTSLAQLEQTLLTTPGITFTKLGQEKEFKVNLPTVVNLYADYNVTSKFNITLFMQKRSGNNNDNKQISSENFFSVTPRVDFGFFETFVPISVNEISGTTSGLGFRLGGLFIGSNSIVTALLNDTKQADVYFGFRIGIL
jgi:hypothetical protein